MSTVFGPQLPGDEETSLTPEQLNFYAALVGSAIGSFFVATIMVFNKLKNRESQQKTIKDEVSTTELDQTTPVDLLPLEGQSFAAAAAKRPETLAINYEKIKKSYDKREVEFLKSLRSDQKTETLTLTLQQIKEHVLTNGLSEKLVVAGFKTLTEQYSRAQGLLQEKGESGSDDVQEVNASSGSPTAQTSKNADEQQRMSEVKNMTQADIEGKKLRGAQKKAQKTSGPTEINGTFGIGELFNSPTQSSDATVNTELKAPQEISKEEARNRAEAEEKKKASRAQKNIDRRKERKKNPTDKNASLVVSAEEIAELRRKEEAEKQARRKEAKRQREQKFQAKVDAKAALKDEGNALFNEIHEKGFGSDELRHYQEQLANFFSEDSLDLEGVRVTLKQVKAIFEKMKQEAQRSAEQQHNKATDIQRVYRGRLGRNTAKPIIESRRAEIRQELANQQAAEAQRQAELEAQQLENARVERMVSLNEKIGALHEFIEQNIFSDNREGLTRVTSLPVRPSEQVIEALEKALEEQVLNAKSRANQQSLDIDTLTFDSKRLLEKIPENHKQALNIERLSGSLSSMADINERRATITEIKEALTKIEEEARSQTELEAAERAAQKIKAERVATEKRAEAKEAKTIDEEDTLSNLQRVVVSDVREVGDRLDLSNFQRKLNKRQDEEVRVIEVEEGTPLLLTNGETNTSPTFYTDAEEQARRQEEAHHETEPNRLQQEEGGNQHEGTRDHLTRTLRGAVRAVGTVQSMASQVTAKHQELLNGDKAYAKDSKWYTPRSASSETSGIKLDTLAEQVAHAKGSNWTKGFFGGRTAKALQEKGLMEKSFFGCGPLRLTEEGKSALQEEENSATLQN